MYPSIRRRERRVVRRRLAMGAVALLVSLAQFAVYLQVVNPPRAEAGAPVAQTYYTPFEAQEFIEILRGISGNAGCCSGSVVSTLSITSGRDANVVFYDHFEDGYELDPTNPVQASTVTINLDSGGVWKQTSTIPIDQGPGSNERGAGNFFDGRDKIVAMAPIAVTQAAYATTPGTLHAGAVQVLDLDKSGTRFDVPAGEDVNYAEVFDYVGMVVVASRNNTTIQIDADADGIFETSVDLDEGQTHVVPGGLSLGAVVESNKAVSAYLTTGDVGATYEGRMIELYPTSVWSNDMVSPVGAYSAADGTRVFLFNPNPGPITIDVLDGAGGTASIAVPARGQASHLMPVAEGARFTSTGGEDFYGFQMITTDGTQTSAFDWGFTLVPMSAATPSVIVPLGLGAGDLVAPVGPDNNYSPVWIASNLDTRLYVDRDGDPSTGAFADPLGNQYDFHCDVTAYQSLTLYDDGTTNCYSPTESADQAGGDRDTTGARIYTLTEGARLSAAWGQRPQYNTGSPALDMGTTILPFPEIVVVKGSTLSTDLDGDGYADPGDVIRYTMAMENLGFIDVHDIVLTDDDPPLTSYVANSTTLDGVPQPDNGSPYSPSPLDSDSPGGGLQIATIAPGQIITAVFEVEVGSPIPIGETEVINQAVMVANVGRTTATDVMPYDVPPLQIEKTSSVSSSPVGSGDTISYTIRVYNAAVTPQTAVAVTDTLPAGTTYVPGSVAADLDGTPVVAGDPPNLVSGLTMPAESWLTITFDVTVDAPIAVGTSGFTNQAEATSAENPTPVTDDATDTAGALADLSLVKVDDEVAALSPGDRLVYTLTVTNAGPDEAASVVVTDTLPSEVTFVPASSDPSCVEGPVGTITCSLGDMGLGSVDVVIAVDVNAGTNGTITNDAAVTSSTPEGNPGDEDASENTEVDAAPTLTVTKSAAPGSVPEPGGTVTFSVSVENTSVEAVTITSLVDDVFGDLLDAGNGAVSANTCPSQPTALAIGETLACSFDADVAGAFGDPDHLDTVTATATDGTGNTVSEYDSATVAFDDSAPTVSITKTPSVTSITEPGGPVTFDLVLTNSSGEPVDVVSLVDDVFGDLLDGANPDVTANSCETLPTSIAAGVTLACSFDALVIGDASGPDHTDTVELTVTDDEANVVTADDSATVTFDDAPPEATVTKTPSTGTITEPGGTVTFTVEVTNTGADTLTLDALVDDVFGDLLDAGNGSISNNTCPSLAATIAPDSTVTCSFDGFLAGLYGDPDHIDVVTATVTDDEGTTITPSDDAVVAFGPANSTVSGLVFEDLDLDGIRDAGEPGLGGIDLVVTGSGGSPTTVTTAGDGTWQTAVLPGDTTVEVDESTVPPTHLLTTANATQVITAVVDTDVAADDVGYGPPAGSITGIVFLDLDGDPDRDAFEPTFEGVTVTLFDGGGGMVDSVETDTDGAYAFTDLPAGTYTVVVDADDIGAGYAASVDPDGITDDETEITLAVDEDLVDVDFGYAGVAVVGDTVWLDEDENGLWGAGEPKLEGAELTLTWAGADGIFGTSDDYGFGTRITDVDGAYQFAGLPPGTYRLIVTTPAEGSGDPTTSTDISVVLAPGEEFWAADFGFAPEQELPFTGLDAEHLMITATLLIGLGWLVLADGRKRNRVFEIALERIRR